MPTFYDRFIECSERWPQNIALEIQRTNGVESYTYTELRRMAESFGAWLVAQGMPAGSRIAVLADNHPRWVAGYLGIIAAGGVAVPLDTAYHADQVAKLLKDSGTELLVCDRKHLETSQEAVAGTNVEILLTERVKDEGTDVPSTSSGQAPARPNASPTRVGISAPPQPITDFDAIFAQPTNGFKPVARPLDDIASLLYTSGTTADPKGVMLTHANLLGEADAVFAWADIGPNDAILGVLPLFHVLSQMANLLLPLVAGARAVYLSTLNTTELLRALQERNITAFAVVPQFFNLIHERIFKEVQQKGGLTRTAFRVLRPVTVSCRRLGFNPGKIFFGKIHALFGNRMRFLVTGGSRFDPQIARDFYSLGIDVLQAYGLTETTGGAFVNSHEHLVIGSVGKPLKGVEAKIVDPQAAADDSQPSGEIIMRGPIIMKGYWNRPDATAEVLKDNWLYTGDLGYFDAAGNLFITGRKKEVIILSNGKNIYPEEIEAHYLQSPFIKEICVMGMEGADKLYAVVIPNFEVLRQRKVVNAKEVIRFDIEGLSAKLASTKRISGYEIWQEDLPRTTTRKLKRFEIQKRVKAGKGAEPGEVPSSRPLTPEETTWLEKSEVQRALKIIREYSTTNPGQIRPADNLELDLGLDSMRRVELLVAIEQELGGDVPESQLGGIYTVRELLDAVRESAASGAMADAGARPTRTFAGWSAVLREDPTDVETLRITKPRRVLDPILFFLSRFISWWWRLVSRVDVQGMENLPHNGAYLLCSNHQSFLDPIILMSLLPYGALKHMFAVGTSEIFGSGFMRQVARMLKVVVVDPDANLVPAIRSGAYGLRHGLALVLYPEGERSIDGTPRIFKKGAAILSTHLQVPIVPVAIEGFYDAWPRNQRFQKFAPLKIKIGKPLQLPPESQASEETYAKYTAQLKETVVGMWNQLRSSKADKASA
ncbi:MAG TPA: AMP-binding protein [Terriglobales bacterium]|nr:AMP-binding protein [Terriglobales bacterium]